MLIQVIADETSDGLWIGDVWTLDFNGVSFDYIHLENIGFLETTFPDEWRFSIDSNGRLEFGSSTYVVKGPVQTEFIPMVGEV
jgi:hypothetical protein